MCINRKVYVGGCVNDVTYSWNYVMVLRVENRTFMR